jgi:hypothetical protein
MNPSKRVLIRDDDDDDDDDRLVAAPASKAQKQNDVTLTT